MLIAAPTGSGKTLAAFLAAIDALVRQGARRASSPDETQVVYVSPLKALSNDIQQEPRSAARRHPRGAARRAACPTSRSARWVRTGDTPPAERDRDAPHAAAHPRDDAGIALHPARLANPAARMLATARTVIVDEIHAVAPNKRGSHLALSLERLDALCGGALQRIGLSATQKPIEEVARFLVGAGAAAAEPTARSSTPAIAARATSRSKLPSSPLEAVMSGEVWEEVYDRIAELIAGAPHDAGLRQHAPHGRARDARTCRSGSARTQVAAHHGSLAKERRLDAEQRLKARRAEGAGRDRLARARHRHRRRRSGLPARLAALDRRVPAARRALGPRGRRHAEGPAVPAVARRAGRMRRAARQRRARRARPRSRSRSSRSTCWRSRSSPRSRRRNGARTTLFALVRRAGRTASCRARTSTRSCGCWPRASARGAAGAAR